MTAPGITALHPVDSQQVFRAVLAALAEPGSPVDLPETGAVPPALLPVLALADLSTGVCVLEDPEQRWSEAVATATSAPLWPAEMARLVAALRPVTTDEVRSLCRGSAHTPEDGATVTIGVRDVAGGPRRWRLSGPGIDGHAVLAPVGLPDGFLAARADAVGGYPAGIDVLLVTDDGRIVGMPRTTTITEEN